MNENIAELMKCCRSLESDKATERKKQVENLKQVLNKTSVIRSLDKNSDNKSSKVFTWDHVFRYVQSYIIKEIELIKKAKAGSATAVSSRDRRKQEISALFKWTIRVANKRGERLKCNEIIQHIMEIMEEDFTFEAFGVDYSNVLLKDVLEVRKYWCELSQKTWQALLKIYCHVMLEPPCRFNRDILARIIYVLMSGATIQCNIHGRRYFSFFNEVMKQLRTEKSGVVLCNIISAMNLFCKSVALNSRRQICKLGEDIATTLLFLWSSRPSSDLKDEIAEFLSLQMSIHHPNGVSQESHGAYANDMQIWKSHLRKLYEAIYNDLQQLGGRNKFLSSSRETSMKSSYIELAADVCHQIFAERTTEIEVTQMTFGSSTQFQTGNRTKRRRVESGWEMIRDEITQLAQSKECIPWLQLLSRLLSKHPVGLPSEEIQSFLNTLHQLLTESKRSDVSGWLLECLQALCKCQSCKDQSLFVVEGCRPLWTKVWTATLRTISLHHAEQQGFELICSLVETQLVTADKELWRLLAYGTCQPSRHAVHCLATLLKHCPLPEHLQPSTAIGMTTVTNSNYPLRHQLLKWLLPMDEDIDGGEKTVKVVDRPSCHVLPEVLSALTQRNTSTCNFQSQEMQREDNQFFKHIETVYLKSSFDFSSETCTDKSRATRLDVRYSRIVAVLKSLIKTMETIGNQLLETMSSEVSHVENMIHHCSVVAKVIALLLGYQTIKKDEVIGSKLFEQIRLLMKRISDNVKELRNKRDVDQSSKVQTMSIVVKALTQLYSWHHLLLMSCEMKDGIEWMANNCRKFTSPELIDNLLEIVNTKTSSRSSVSMTTQNDIDDDFMDIDVTDNRSVDDFDFDVVDDRMETQDQNDTTQNSANQSLLNPEQLTEQQQLCIECIGLLCTWCVSARSDKYSCSQVDPHTVKNQLLDFLDEEDFDVTKPFHLQKFVSVSEGLLLEESHMSDAHLETILYNLQKKVASIHRKDQEVCCMTLNLLTKIIPCLDSQGNGVSEDLNSAREISLYLMSVFWKLQVEGQYSTSVRQALALCMQAFIQVDPEEQWAIMKQTSKQRGDGDHTPMPSLVEQFPDLLKDKSHGIRMHVAESVTCLFTRQQSNVSKTVSTDSPTNGVKAVSTDKQDKAFNQVLVRVQEAANVPNRLAPEEHTDEWNNRASSLLKTLISIACCSAVCEKRCVFALIQAIKENNIDINVMNKVLGQMTSHLKYPTIQSFLESHLGYIIANWLEVGYSLQSIPYQLFSCKTRLQFYKQYYKTLVPYLVIGSKLETVQSLGHELQKDWKDLLIECFPQIIIHIIPTFAYEKEAEPATEQQQRRKTNASQVLNKIQQILTQQVMEKLIQSNLDEIVVELLMTLHEPYSEDSDIGQFAKDTDPHPNPPYFTSYTIKATLDYLTGCHHGNKSLVSLLSKTQDSIQKILFHLHIHMCKAHHVYEKRRALLMYRLFTVLLLNELHDGLGSAWAFVLKDTIHTLVHFMDHVTNCTELVYICIDLLHTVSDTAVKCCSEEFGKHLNVIITALIPHTDKDTNISRQAVSLVDFLLVENEDKLSLAIEELDPLPDTIVFTDARRVQTNVKYKGGDFDLLQEIHQFLRVGQICETSNRLEGLRHLRKKLAEKKDELAILVFQCEENPTESALIQLICELIYIIQLSNHGNSCHGNQKAIEAEAGRCLGEIGAAQLSTIALKYNDDNKSYNTALNVYKNNEKMKRNSIIIHLLKDYLIDPSVDILSAAASCLRDIFSTSTGVKFYEDYKAKNIDKVLFYLYPFKPHRKRVLNVTAASTDEETFASSIGDPLLWMPDHDNHDKWICNLATTLIESEAFGDEFLRLLTPICKVKVEFSEKILPYLIHEILLTGNDTYKQVISHQIQNFFAKHCGNLEDSSRATTPLPMSGDSSSSKISKQSMRTMLEVIHYLRQQNKPKPGRASKTMATVWENNFWLDIDYLQIAKAAQSCAAHFTCALYTEIWCDIQKSKSTKTNKDSEEDLMSQGSQNSMEILSSLSSHSSINVQSLLLEAYSSIGEPDGVYGCGAGRSTDTAARIHTYEHEHAWDKALTAYDLEIQTPLMSTQIGLLQSLQNFGVNHVLQTYLQGLNKQLTEQTPELSEFQYQAAWRNCQWDIEEQDRSLDSGSPHGYNQSLYTSLCALRDKEPSILQDCISQARQEVILSLNDASLESIRNIYFTLSQLQSLVDLEDFSSLILKNSINYELVQSKWNTQSSILSQNDYEFLEPVLTLRGVLLQLLLENDQKRDNRDGKLVLEWLMQHLQYTAQIARKANRHQAAERAIFSLKQLDQYGTMSESEVSWSWRLEEAKMYWARGEQDTAKHTMKQVTDKLAKVYTRSRSLTRLYAHALGIHGNWLAETHSESPNTIMSIYLEKAVNLYEAVEDSSQEAMEAYLALARFADLQYQTIVNYMKSPTFESKQALMRKTSAELTKIERMKGRSKYTLILAKQQQIDEQEMENLKLDKNTFLDTAIDNYMRCLEIGDFHDMRVFRLISLWFENDSDDEVNKKLQTGLPRIQSRKFLPLMYQLAARMTTRQHDDDSFHPTLNQLIERTTLDHPHHTLFVILALSNANKDDVMLNPKPKKSSKLATTKSTSSSTNEDRMQAAKNMLGRLQNQRGVIITAMERLCDAYIQLAYFNVDQYKKETRPINLPSELKLPKLKDLKHVAMPTTEIPVDPQCCYDNIVYIKGFEPTFRLAGGINLPKIITCIASDGTKKKQLVKGRDDLRQDAVMQQMFGLVNKLLQKDPETRKRKLTVRRYKVIPLSQRSGILEWCEGTIPLGEYLIGNQRTNEGAHQRYNPRQLSPWDCRRRMNAAHDKGQVTDKNQTYRNVCDRFHPVFRHFFLENFQDPAVWFERRLAYTRSVATSSIVGYVVGLGDRHVQNILIDCNTAELVHIDLGVAFEQGRILPTPETVPFRLTRDIVDGMGVAEVEGVFRRCCEKTMEVMHNNQEALLTIVEVLLYDPLYVWTLSPIKAIQLQQTKADPDVSELNITTAGERDLLDGAGDSNETNTEESNKMAERVLLRLQQKLKGVEEGVVVSVSGQINRLIQEARDPKNLCKLFPGWQSWI